jgi:Tripartite tricarboxylate transporter TctB family
MAGTSGDRAEGRGEPQAEGADLVIPALALAFSAYFFWSIAGLDWEAKANGVVIGAVLLVLLALQIGRVALAVRRGRATLGFDPLLHPWPVQLRRLALVALLALFVATISTVGTLLGLILCFASMMWVLGVREVPWLIGLPVAVATVLHLLFVTFLGANLPRGPVEQALSAVFGAGS